jgi:hypothetical protein
MYCKMSMTIYKGNDSVLSVHNNTLDQYANGTAEDTSFKHVRTRNELNILFNAMWTNEETWDSDSLENKLDPVIKQYQHIYKYFERGDGGDNFVPRKKLSGWEARLERLDNMRLRVKLDCFYHMGEEPGADSFPERNVGLEALRPLGEINAIIEEERRVRRENFRQLYADKRSNLRQLKRAAAAAEAGESGESGETGETGSDERSEAPSDPTSSVSSRPFYIAPRSTDPFDNLVSDSLEDDSEAPPEIAVTLGLPQGSQVSGAYLPSNPDSLFLGGAGSLAAGGAFGTDGGSAAGAASFLGSPSFDMSGGSLSSGSIVRAVSTPPRRVSSLASSSASSSASRTRSRRRRLGAYRDAVTVTDKRYLKFLQAKKSVVVMKNKDNACFARYFNLFLLLHV